MVWRVFVFVLFLSSLSGASLIPAVTRQRWADHFEFEAILVYIVFQDNSQHFIKRPYLKKIFLFLVLKSPKNSINKPSQYFLVFILEITSDFLTVDIMLLY